MRTGTRRAALEIWGDMGRCSHRHAERRLQPLRGGVQLVARTGERDVGARVEEGHDVLLERVQRVGNAHRAQLGEQPLAVVDALVRRSARARARACVAARVRVRVHGMQHVHVRVRACVQHVRVRVQLHARVPLQLHARVPLQRHVQLVHAARLALVAALPRERGRTEARRRACDAVTRWR